MFPQPNWEFAENLFIDAITKLLNKELKEHPGYLIEYVKDNVTHIDTTNFIGMLEQKVIEFEHQKSVKIIQTFK